MTTVNRWIASYTRGGLEAVIERGTNRNHRPLKADVEVLEYLNDESHPSQTAGEPLG